MPRSSPRGVQPRRGPYTAPRSTTSKPPAYARWPTSTNATRVAPSRARNTSLLPTSRARGCAHLAVSRFCKLFDLPGLPVSEAQAARYREELPAITTRLTFAGAFGERIKQHVSQKAWNEWLEMQIKVINEYRLHMGEARHREVLAEHAAQFLRFDGGDGRTAQLLGLRLPDQVCQPGGFGTGDALTEIRQLIIAAPLIIMLRVGTGLSFDEQVGFEHPFDRAI